MSRKPNNYWKSWQNVEQELKEVIGEIGYFPAANELKQMKKSYLVRAIVEFHGGFSEVRKKMGYNNGREKPGYWQEWKNVDKELKKLISSINQFPSCNDFKTNDKGSLFTAIGRYHGGLSQIKQKLGYESYGSKPHGYWKSKENVDRELQSVVNNIGKFPNSGELQKRGLGSLNVAISKYHGGIREVKLRFENG